MEVLDEVEGGVVVELGLYAVAEVVSGEQEQMALGDDLRRNGLLQAGVEDELVAESDHGGAPGRVYRDDRGDYRQEGGGALVTERQRREHRERGGGNPRGGGGRAGMGGGAGEL